MNSSRKQSNIVARLTVEFSSGKREAFEIYTNASFEKFYHLYVFTSLRKKSPKSIPTQNRNYSQALRPTFHLTGLEGMLALISDSFRVKADPIKSSKIVIYKKRLYTKLLTMAPDTLPGGGLPIAKNMHLRPVISAHGLNTSIKVSHRQEKELRKFFLPNLVGARAEVNADA